MRFPALLFPLLLLPSLALAAPPDDGFFPVSVWYAGGKARAPMLSPITPRSEAEWSADLAKIKSLGFNTVRTWVEWAAGEPHPGEYHLEQLDLLLRLAQKAGLRVIVQTYVDSAPDWVGVKFPDGRFVAQNGDAIPSQAAPGFCFDHPGVREATLNFLREVARHVARSNAFYAWDLWSEPHIINWAEINYIPNASFCYCPYTLARFRRWLEAKYGGLDNLNQAWYRRFDNWNQVEPPRFDTILSYTDYLDWRIFITQKLAADLAARDVAVKAILPNRLTTSHASGPSAFSSFAGGDGNPDDYLMYKSVDYYGTSLYPKHSLPPHMSPLRVQMAVDLTRSAGNNHGFYIGELQGGFGIRGDVVSQEITPSDLVRYMWTAISRGSRGINIYAFYPMSSGYEAGGYGLIDLDGTLTPRSKAAGVAARQIAANRSFLLHAHPKPAEVAILVNQVTNLVGGAGHFYNRGAVAQSLSGYYRMFNERNIPIDFVNATDVNSASLAHYKLVVLPYPLLVFTGEAAALEQYVQSGGHLYSEARPGWIDERGYAQPAIPGFAWQRMFGVREKSVTPMPELTLRWGSHTFPSAVVEERFTVVDPSAKPLAWFEDGSPAAYEHAFGKGSAILAGSLPGQAYSGTEAISRQRANIIVGSLPAAAVSAPHPLGAFLAAWAHLSQLDIKTTAPVDVEQLIGPTGRMVFFLNWQSTPARVDLTLPLARPPHQVNEITTGASVVPSMPLHVETEVPAGGIRVYRINE
jgi:beta-galactosidase